MEKIEQVTNNTIATIVIHGLLKLRTLLFIINSKDEIIKIYKLLVKKNGIRSIERITNHHRDTIGHLLDDLAIHEEFVNNLLLNEIKLGQLEVDDIWTIVKKTEKIKQGTPQSNEQSDAWV